MTQKEHFLSLIIPVFKQEKTVVKNVLQIQKILDTIRYDYEILIVIDGLVDRSHQRLKNAKIPKTKLIFFHHNQGKAYAIRTGMEKAKGDYIMFMDSGMEINPNGISMLLEHMEWYNADIIVGSKRHPASHVQYSQQRKILSYGYYYLVKLLFGIKVSDTQAGIKIFKKNVLKKILPKLVERKFTGDLEMLIAANTLGFTRIYEAPIKLKYAIGPLSNAATVQSIAGILLDTLAIWYRTYILKWYTDRS